MPKDLSASPNTACVVTSWMVVYERSSEDAQWASRAIVHNGIWCALRPPVAASCPYYDHR